ncbi:MAG: hypothetical protein ACE37F_03440 [Nannocystaceae bacterium]|nr:hypothetical protein [bacterium]
MTFKERYRDLQEIIREMLLLRSHNRQFQAGDSQETMLMFAEACVVLLALERFLRVILQDEATERDTLPNLLEKATSKRVALLSLPPGERAELIRRVKDVRNTTLHGGFEQAARDAECGSVADYFATQFAPEVEAITNLLEGLMGQIDPETGHPRP